MKTKIKHNKLVRDKIPEIISADGAVPVYEILDHTKYKKALLKKLVEEAKECAADPTRIEFADLYEVMRTYLEVDGWDINHIVGIADARKETRGGFKEKIFLKSIIQDDVNLET